ncbi:MAG TPA: hypothetical protein VNN12_02470 [Dehalococcoidia bacterium]|nr:hypothetical protein [Dehalococcoidia bacterium]
MRRDAGGGWQWSGEDGPRDDTEGGFEPLFEEGQRCDACGVVEGRVGIDPTCGGVYDGEPTLVCYDCLGPALRRHYGAMEGIAVVVEPAAVFDTHDYYRIDEMAAYEFLQEDIDTVAWMLLEIGGECQQCGEQSHVLWLPIEAIDIELPDDTPIFVNPDAPRRFLCGTCAGEALARAYRASERRLLQVEVPRAAMGLLLPGTT